MSPPNRLFDLSGLLHFPLPRIATLVGCEWISRQSEGVAYKMYVEQYSYPAPSKYLQIIDHGGGDPNNELVEWEFAEIVEAINYEKANKVPIKELISDRGLMWRAFICISCGVFSQTSGNGLISTYLSTILVSAGITDAKDIVTINGSISIWSWIVGVGCAIFTSRLKRRTVFLTGLTTMLIIFIGWTVAQAQYDMHGVKAAGYAVIAIVFLYNAAYAYSLLYLVSCLCDSVPPLLNRDMILTSLQVVAYPIEIAPYRWRVRMWSLTLLAISIAAFFNSYVNVSKKAIKYPHPHSTAHQINHVR